MAPIPGYVPNETVLACDSEDHEFISGNQSEANNELARAAHRHSSAEKTCEKSRRGNHADCEPRQDEAIG
jgi:hypothetical protein